MKIGDLVEVKFARYNTKRGRSVVDEWRPATVVMTSDAAITVEFEDRTRQVVGRGRHQFRRAKNDTNMG